MECVRILRLCVIVCVMTTGVKGCLEYKIGTIIKGETISRPLYAKTAENCQDICAENFDCEFWNFEFVFYEKGDSWSLTGFGRCEMGKNMAGEVEEEYFIAGLKESCQEGVAEKNDNNTCTMMLVLVVLLSVHTLGQMLIVLSVTTLLFSRRQEQKPEQKSLI
eukprot:GFUD01095479.1.p1 GENE.GFUD01095479.1~~GFUD01095479.1.p1  ORF type:complete len:163 (+),score=37.45 GFUD01095479.1:1-489(+)